MREQGHALMRSEGLPDKFKDTLVEMVERVNVRVYEEDDEDEQEQIGGKRIRRAKRDMEKRNIRLFGDGSISDDLKYLALPGDVD